MFLVVSLRKIFKLYTVKPPYSGHKRFLKKVPAIRRCPLHRVLDFFEEKYHIRVVVTVTSKRVNSVIGLGIDILIDYFFHGEK